MGSGGEVVASEAATRKGLEEMISRIERHFKVLSKLK
jgi:hypothetical protein